MKARMKDNTKRGAIGIVMIILIVIIVTGAIIGFSFVGTYNRGQTLDENIESSWAQVETVLQRRYDLIPNLVNTVQGFADQEREILTEVTRLRSQWGEARTISEKAGAASGLEGALGRLMLISENYPQLTSNTNFLSLQSQLEGTENRISVERRRYNEAVRAFNTFARQFPNNVLFDPRDDYFEATSGADSAPVVSFD